MNIIISGKFEEKKARFLRGGKGNLHIISDFDRTLTTEFVEGKRIPSVISILRDEKYLTPDYPAKAHALFDYYHPIEINPDISIEEKKKEMDKWWIAHFKLLIESGLNVNDLKRVVKEGRVRFRKGALEFFDFLNKNNQPLDHSFF